MTYDEIQEKSYLSCEGCCFNKEIKKPKANKGVVVEYVSTGQSGCYAPFYEPFTGFKKRHVIFKVTKED